MFACVCMCSCVFVCELICVGHAIRKGRSSLEGDSREGNGIQVTKRHEALGDQQGLGSNGSGGGRKHNDVYGNVTMKQPITHMLTNFFKLIGREGDPGGVRGDV